ncbi:MAG: 50S ribosomal protein L25 [Desulfobulbaceae bacterium]|jgi:large subunit ribosomal protein L25|nr:50S ribosomal protein L25 [Desulfobulbaceae bacterium]
MLQCTIDVAKRDVTGKGPMRRLRSQGIIPAVTYGAGSEATLLQTDGKSLRAKLLEYARRNTVVTLNIEGGAQKHVIIGEIQTNPVTNALIHVDFCEIDLEKSRRYDVPVRFVGVPKGVDLGGILQTFVDHIVLEGKPLDVPDECTLDITGLAIGDQYTFAAFNIPDNLKMLSKADQVCVQVVKLVK